MELYWLSEVPLWLLIMPVLLFVLLVPMEAGFRLGLRQRRAYPDAE